MKFLFHSDIEDHKDSTGHKLTEKVMIVMVSPAETRSNGNHNRVIDLS
ncbi:MAG: hypothetical protein ACJ701_06495 [Nitrososphaera sp.]|jgi:hypothetical protein